MMRRHIEYQHMVAAYDGLPPAERKEIDAHLVACAACAAALAGYRGMDAELRSAHSVRAGAGMRLRFDEAMSSATAAPAPQAARRVIQEPVIRQARRPRQPWTWSRALVPLGFVLLFAVVVALSIPRDGGNAGAALRRPVAVPVQQAQIVELRFNCETNVAYGGLYKVIEAFEAENPDIKIRYTPASVTGNDQQSYVAGLADAAAKSDVFCALPDISDLQRDIVIDVAPYIANDATFRPEDFYPGTLRASPENGAILSIPTYILPLMISYDANAFDEAGIRYPQPGWTWDDFLATAVKLTQRQGADTAQWGFYEIGGGVFMGRLHAGWSMDFQTPPDYPSMGEILRWYEAMYVRERAAAAPPALDWVEGQSYRDRSLEKLLAAGQLAMWEDSGMASLRLGSAVRQSATYPEPNQGAFVGRMSGLVMSGKTQHPDQAWRWISYLSQHLPGQQIPARRSLADRGSFWNELDETSKAAYRYMLDHIAPVNVRLPDAYQHYVDAVIAVAKGEKTVEQALADLDAQVQLRGGPAAHAAESLNAARAAATPFPEAQPVPGVPNLSSNLVQADGESEAEFLARIAVADVLTDSAALLVMYAAPLYDSRVETARLEDATADDAVRCWTIAAGTLEPCPAQTVKQVLAERTDSDETVVRFMVTWSRFYDKVVTYEVETHAGGGMQKQQYRVVLREQDRKWRETAAQATAYLERQAGPLPEQTASTATVTATPDASDVSDGLVQADGERLEDFLARIAVTGLFDRPENALVVAAALEQQDNPNRGVSTRLGSACWQRVDGQLQPCTVPVIDALAANAPDRPIIFYAPIYGVSSVLVLYDVRQPGGQMLTERYRVTLREKDAQRWAVASVEKVN